MNASLAALLSALMAAGGDEAPLKRLDEFTRAKVLLAILGLVLLGVGMIAMVMMGGRYVRRLARHRPEPPHPTVPFGVPKRPAPDELSEEPPTEGDEHAESRDENDRL